MEKVSRSSEATEQFLNFKIRDSLRLMLEQGNQRGFIELVELLEYNLQPVFDEEYREDIKRIEEAKKEFLEENLGADPFQNRELKKQAAYDAAKEKYGALIRLLSRKGLTGALDGFEDL